MPDDLTTDLRALLARVPDDYDSPALPALAPDLAAGLTRAVEALEDESGAARDVVARSFEIGAKLDEAQAMLDAVRGRAEQDGMQVILDVLDRKPVPGPVPGYLVTP